MSNDGPNPLEENAADLLASLKSGQVIEEGSAALWCDRCPKQRLLRVFHATDDEGTPRTWLWVPRYKSGPRRSPAQANAVPGPDEPGSALTALCSRCNGGWMIWTREPEAIRQRRAEGKPVWAYFGVEPRDPAEPFKPGDTPYGAEVTEWIDGPVPGVVRGRIDTPTFSTVQDG